MSAPGPVEGERVIARSTGGPVACRPEDDGSEEPLRPAFYAFDERIATVPVPTSAKEV